MTPPFPINHTALGCRGGWAGAAFREQRLGMRSPPRGDGKGDPSPTPAVSHVCRTLRHESPLREHIEPFLSLVSFFFRPFRSCSCQTGGGGGLQGPLQSGRESWRSLEDVGQRAARCSLPEVELWRRSSQAPTPLACPKSFGTPYLTWLCPYCVPSWRGSCPCLSKAAI